MRLSATASTSFILILAAEMGDKSQLVCMTLASKHRGLPVILGAVAAFALLNTLAVMFGAALSNWIPPYIIAALVALLFAVFGLFSLFGHEDEEDDEVVEKSGHGIFLTTFMMITLAEFGDKNPTGRGGLQQYGQPLCCLGRSDTGIGADLGTGRIGQPHVVAALFNEYSP